MELAAIARRYLTPFKARHGALATSAQRSALNAILGCRTEQYGQVFLACKGCATTGRAYLSCGHRSCNQCQNHCASQWLERQQRKLLPVPYFMVTFTLPAELRPLAKAQPRTMYALLFQCAVSILKDFGRNKKGLEAELAMMAVLHTHTRRLDFHPHVHVVVPGGGINQKAREWRPLSGKYLFNGRQLATVFRARLLKAITESGLRSPPTPSRWVAQCQSVGNGLPALKYLSQYLYRGVVSNKNIIADNGENVTFRYRESRSGTIKTRTLRGEDFLALLLQHTLPKGFRRSRDYGFLHGNAKALLSLLHWVLKFVTPEFEPAAGAHFTCPKCKGVMAICGFKRKPCPG